MSMLVSKFVVNQRAFGMSYDGNVVTIEVSFIWLIDYKKHVENGVAIFGMSGAMKLTNVLEVL